MSPPGVPIGTRWAITALNWKARDHKMDPNHRGRANVSVKTKCLDGVKTYGNKPIKFNLKIKKKKAKNRINVPGTTSPPKIDRSSAMSRLKTLATQALACPRTIQ